MLPTLVVNKKVMCVHFFLYGLKDCNCSFYLMFFMLCFCYCTGNCICAGQGNTIVSHFVVQRADLIVVIVCVPCSRCHSLIYACEWGFWVCWKTVCCCRIKPLWCRLPAVVSIFTDSAAWVTVLLHSTAPLHMNCPFERLKVCLQMVSLELTCRSTFRMMDQWPFPWRQCRQWWVCFIMP